MLTIENFQRLKGKVIGITGYYVESIKPVVLMDTKTLENTHWYMIELTNRKQFLMLQLDRTGFATGTRMKLYELKLGQNYINLTKFQLRNIDIVVDKIGWNSLQKQNDMLTIENRGYIISDSFYDKMGMYWVVDKIIDNTDEYLILIENRKGPKELFSLKKENLYDVGYQLGLLDDNRHINKNMFRVKTYIPIETIRDKKLLVKRMNEMIDTAYDI